jgi:homoprotocatechuate degradation regulator HpaR
LAAKDGGMMRQITTGKRRATHRTDDGNMRPFSRSLPMQLMRARELVMQRFRPHLHAHGLTEQQWRVIRALVEVESLEIGEVAERCWILPASLSRILPKLAKSGLVRRSPNKRDQRRVTIALTPAGKRYFDLVAPESEKIYAEISALVGPRQLDDVYRAIGVLISSLTRKN